MANLGTLWFGSDIDLTELKKKIGEGNKEILDALKMNYDPQSYQQMVNKLRSELNKETFEIKISADTSALRGAQGGLSNLRQYLGGGKGITGGLDEINEKIRDQTMAVNALKARLESLRATYSSLKGSGQLLQASSYRTQIAETRRELALEKQTLQDFIIQRNALRNSTQDSLLNLRREAAEHRNTSAAARRATQERTQAVRQLNSDHLRLNTTLAGGVHVSTQLGSALSAIFAAHAAREFLGSVIEIGGQLEKQRISMGAILGDTARANELFGQIKGLAVKSPFGVVELDQYSKQLAAYGIEQGNLFDMTKRLADISAGAGQDIGRLALALGHVKSATYLTGITLRQFSMNNIPMLKMLADYYSEVEKRAVSTAEVQKRISQRQVSYEDVVEQIKRMTDEGGQFYNMQEKISESVSAKWKNLRDSIDIMYGDMAESSMGDALKGTAEILMSLTTNWKTVGVAMVSVVVAFGLARSAMYATNVASEKLAASYGILGTRTTALTASQLSEWVAEGRVTKQHILNAVATSRLTVEQAKEAASTWGVTEAQLQQIAAGRKVEQVLGANVLATSRFTISQLRAMATLRATSLEFSIFGRNISIAGKRFLAFRLVSMGAINAVGMAWKTLVASLNTLAPFAAISALTYAWQKNSEEAEKASAVNDAMFERMTEGFKNAREMMKETNMSLFMNGKKVDLDALGSGNTTIDAAAARDVDADTLKKNIETWTEFIKEYSPMKNTMLNAAFAIDENGKAVHSLSEQYDILKTHVVSVIDAMANYDKVGKIVSDAIKDADGWLSDSLIEDLSDFDESYQDHVKIVNKSVSTNKQAAAAALAAARENTEFAAALKESGISVDDLSSQIILLTTNQEKFASALDTFRSNYPDDWGVMKSSFDLGADWVNLETEFKQVAENIRNQIDFESLTESQRKAFGLAFTQTFMDVAVQAKMSSEDAKDAWMKLCKTEFPDIVIDAKTADAAYKVSALKDELSKLVNEEWVIKVDSVSNYSDLIDKIRKEHKGAKEFFNNAKNAIKLRFGIDMDVNAPKKLDEEALLKNVPFFQQEQMRMLIKEWNSMVGVFSNATKWSEATGVSLEDPNKKKKNSGGKKEDAELKKWKERKKALDEYYKLYKEYSEYMSSDEAFEKLNKTGLIQGQSLPNNIGDYLQVLKDFQNSIGKGKINTTDRRNFWTSLIGDINKADFEQNTKKAADALLKQLDKEIEERSKGYALYKKVLNATGNEALAGKFAFGGGVSFENFAQELRHKISEAIKSKGIGVSINDLLQMNDDKLRNHGILEKGIDGIYEMLRKLREEESKLREEDVDLFLEALKNAESLETQLERIHQKYERARTAVRSQGGDEQLLNNIDNNESRDISEARWEWFKKMNGDWGRIFANLDEISTRTLQNMLIELSNLAPAINEDVKSLEALYKAMDRIQQALNSRNPLAAIRGSLSNLSALRGYRKQAEMKGDLVANKKLSNLLGVKLGSIVSKGQINDGIQREEDKFAKGLAGLTSKIKAVQDVLAPVITMLDNMGAKGASSVLSAGSNAFGAAAQTAQGLNSLKDLFGAESGIGKALGAAGPWGAAASAALSVGSQLMGMFGADYSEYEEAKTRYEGLSSVWDELIEKKRTYLSKSWGTEAVAASQEALDLLDTKLREVKVTATTLLDSGASIGSHSIGYRVWNKYGARGDTNKGYLNNGMLASAVDGEIHWNQVNQAIEKGLSAAGLGVAKLENAYGLIHMSGKQLEWIRENYTGLWAVLDGDFKEYLNDIIQFGETKIDILEEMKERITGTTFDSFFDGFTEGLYKVVDDVDDATKTMADSWRDMMNKMVINNMVATKYKERLESLFKQWGSAYDDEIITKAERDSLTSEYDTIRDKAMAEVRALKDAGLLTPSANISDSEASGTINAAKSMSDDTGNEMVASNTAIRLGVERGNIMMANIQVGVSQSVTVLGEIKDLVSHSNDTAESILEQHVRSNLFLESILDYSRDMYEEWGGEIRAIRNKIDTL